MSTLVSEFKRLLQFISRKPEGQTRRPESPRIKPADTLRPDGGATDRAKIPAQPDGKTQKDRIGTVQSARSNRVASQNGGTNKNGIRILDGEDLTQVFRDKTAGGHPTTTAQKPSRSVARKRKGAQATAVSSPGKARKSPPSKKTRAPQVNRNGLPVFSRDEDLQAMLTADRPDTGDESSKKVFRTGPPDRAVKSSPDLAPGKTVSKPNQLDRHGLPLLDRDSDLYSAFGLRGTLPAREENFSELLEQSLAGKSRQDMWKEKRDAVHPGKPMTAKRRIKRYPPPQAQLDLHGNTAVEAEQKTVSFLRTAKANGLFTLRIIVGKGLHSESGAVLPDVVEDVLVKLKREGIILAFEWEHRLKSKSGSVVAYLVQYP